MTSNTQNGGLARSSPPLLLLHTVDRAGQRAHGDISSTNNGLPGNVPQEGTEKHRDDLLPALKAWGPAHGDITVEHKARKARKRRSGCVWAEAWRHSARGQVRKQGTKQGQDPRAEPRTPQKELWGRGKGTRREVRSARLSVCSLLSFTRCNRQRDRRGPRMPEASTSPKSVVLRRGEKERVTVCTVRVSTPVGAL